MTDEQVKNLDKPKPLTTHSKSDEIVNIVYKMMLDGRSNNEIRRYLEEHTNATYSVINHCIYAVAYNNFPTEKKGHGYERRADGSIAISRSAIFKYLLSLNPRTNDPGSSKCKDGKVGWWLKLLEKKYPVISLFRTVASEFYSVITGEEPEKVDEFIEKYGSEGKSKDKSSNNEKTHAQKILEGFCKGLKQDIEAVKNSIIYKDVSSGPVEGCNNKVKLIKRRGYGRNNLENLGKKCILGFADGIPGFSFKILVSTGKTERFVMHYKRRSKLSLIQITA